MSSEGLHEPESKLQPATIENHRAIVSLMEELEAVDWYQQRADACDDEDLKQILLHNMDEELEHAAMVLEWIRRNNPAMDAQLSEFLFKGGDTERNHQAHTQTHPTRSEEAIMDHLMRDLAPITSRAWSMIDAEVQESLGSNLVGRQLFDVTEALGWQASSIDDGRTTPLKQGTGPKGVELKLRNVQPLVEIRVPFNVPRQELDALARGASDPRLDCVVEAAKKAAMAEDKLVFEGHADAGVVGALQNTDALALPSSPEALPAAVAEAIGRLKSAGVSGPYALALSPELYDELNQATTGGYPVVKHILRLIDSPIVWAPAIEGAVVTSCRGGDFKIRLGTDFAVGYSHHDRESVDLYIVELVTFENLAPEACLALQPE
jgi:uncharacterized linocin/CFP29 family protein